MKKFKSDRIYARELSPDEIDDRMLQWFEDEGLMKYYTNSKRKITKEILEDSIREGKRLGNNYTYAIFDKQTNQAIGTIKIGPINLAHRISDLVVLIGDRNFLGKGLGVESIKLGNEIAFTNHDIRKLFGGMYASNKASIKAYTRAGWIVEGLLSGHYEVDGKNEDRILVGCFNPKYFTSEEIENAKYENRK